MSASIQAANLSDPGQARLVIVGGLSGALAAEGRTAEHHANTGGEKRAMYLGLVAVVVFIGFALLVRT